jgi:hypothetical protein
MFEWSGHPWSGGQVVFDLVVFPTNWPSDDLTILTN